VTVIYKLLFDAAPISADQLSSLQETGLPWPQIPGLPPRSAGRIGDNPPAYLSLGVVGGTLNLVGGIIGGVADGLAFFTEGIPLVSWLSVAQGVAAQALQAPWNLFVQGVNNTADGLTVGLWCASCIPVIYDGVFTFVTGELARYTNVLGPVLDTCAGCALAGVGVAALIFQKQAQPEYTAWDCANSIVPQCARPLRFFILSKTTDPEFAPVAAGILIGADLLIGLGATATQVGAAVEG
jgi:hypothetical protein